MDKPSSSSKKKSGSVLQRLRGQLKDAGLIGHDSKLSSSKNNKTARRKERLDSRKAARQRLVAQKEDANPFELKFAKPKHEVLNRKVRGIGGKPGLTRHKAEAKRIQTLIPQLERKNKESVFVDRRFGEDDPNMTVEEKMMERFVRERQQRARANANLFNLEADETEDLTHYGQSLADLDDLSDDDARLLDEYDSDDEGRGQIGKKEVQRTHFGGFGSDEETEERPKTRAEVMKEIIAKSKAHKAERQRIRDENETIRKELDADLDDIRQLMAASGPRIDEKVPDEYDMLVKSLASEKRARPTDRLKTEVEQAQHQKEELEKLEAQRQQRMLGIVEEVVEDKKGKKRKAEADDLETNFAMDDDEPEALTYKDGQLVNDAIFMKQSKRSKVQEEVESSSEESEDGSEEVSEDESGEEEALSEDESGEEEVVSQESQPEDDTSQVEEIETKPKLSQKELDRIRLEAKNELPYVIPFPESQQEFSQLMLGRSPEHVGTILSRLEILNSTKIQPQNKEKLVNLFKFILSHFVDLAENKPAKQVFPILAILTNHLVTLAKESPLEAATCCLDYIVNLQSQFVKRLGKSDCLPSTGNLLTLQAICRVFPTSDFQHPVTTPLIMFVEQVLGQATFSSVDDILKGFFLQSLVLDFIKLSKRFVPEAVSWLYTLILSLNTKVDCLAFATFPGPETRQFVWKEPNGKSKSKKLSLLWLLNGEWGKEQAKHFKALLFNHASQTLISFAQLYSQKSHLPSFVEVFTPALTLLSGEEVKKMQTLVDEQGQGRTPLELQRHKAVPIATHLPRFQENYSIDRAKYGMDPNRDRAESKKLSKQYKKEFKGAVRELRKDSKFLAKHQLQKVREQDKTYQSKIRSIIGQLAHEEGDMKAAAHTFVRNFADQVSQLLRIRSPEGQNRVEVDGKLPIKDLLDKIRDTLGLKDEFTVSLDPTGNQPIKANARNTVNSAGLQHGTQIFVSYKRNLESTNGNAKVESEPSSSVPNVQADPLDEMLEQQDGLIKRKRDPRFCRHGDLGMCDYCRPMEAYDPRYLEQNKIKHMPFHAYLRKLTSKSTHSVASAHFVPPLDEPSFALKQPCSTGHPPYPEGICSKCQPSAITLQPQDFRMVDHVEFETPGLIDGFLNYWRETGLQRFGWLYGRYEAYSEVALGVKAVVCAIYEPPQQGHTDGIQVALKGSPKSQQFEGGNKVEEEEIIVDRIAQFCGLQRVGMIYSDLQDAGAGDGSVLTKRHQDSYFLSSSEIVFSAQQQLKYPLVTKYSVTGKFGSRFITAVISGNQEGGIEISAYQVSNIGMGMVRDNVTEASVEPTTMLIRESTNKQYVPEAFYKYKNEYGVIVQNPARDNGFPVDYLLVALTHGFPQNPNATFSSSDPFPIENRYPPLPPQVDAGTLKQHLSRGQFADNISDFHMLVYLCSLGILSDEDLKKACDVAIRRNDWEKEAKSLQRSDAWQTLETILATANTSFTDTPMASRETPTSRPTSKTWACRHCTFENTTTGDSCEVCGLPRE